MGDLHVLVVDHVSKVVGREAIPLDDDVVVLKLLLLEVVVDEILDPGGGLGALEPDGELLALGRSVDGLLGINMTACPWVECRLACFVGDSLVLVEGLGGAEASVGLALGNQLVGVRLVEW